MSYDPLKLERKTGCLYPQQLFLRGNKFRKLKMIIFLEELTRNFDIHILYCVKSFPLIFLSFLSTPICNTSFNMHLIPPNLKYVFFKYIFFSLSNSFLKRALSVFNTSIHTLSAPKTDHYLLDHYSKIKELTSPIMLRATFRYSLITWRVSEAERSIYRQMWRPTRLRC